MALHRWMAVQGVAGARPLVRGWSSKRYPNEEKVSYTVVTVILRCRLSRCLGIAQSPARGKNPSLDLQDNGRDTFYFYSIIFYRHYLTPFDHEDYDSRHATVWKFLTKDSRSLELVWLCQYTSMITVCYLVRDVWHCLTSFSPIGWFGFWGGINLFSCIDEVIQFVAVAS